MRTKRKCSIDEVTHSSDDCEFYMVDSMELVGAGEGKKKSEKVLSIADALKMVAGLKSFSIWVDLYYSRHKGITGTARVLYLVLEVYCDLFAGYDLIYEDGDGKQRLTNVGKWTGKPRLASVMVYSRLPMADEGDGEGGVR